MKKIKNLIGIAISIVLLYLLFRNVEFKKLGDVLLGINYLVIVPAILLQISSYWVRSLRWSAMLGSIKKVKTSSLFPIICINYMANSVLPLRGGDIVRAYLIGRNHNISKTAALSTVIVEKIYDGITLLLFMGAISLVYPFPKSIKSLGLIATIIFAGALLFTIFVVLFKERALKLVKFITGLLPEKIGTNIMKITTKLIEGFDIIKDKKSLMPVIMYSIIIWALEGSLVLTIAVAFGVDNVFYLSVFTLVVTNFGIMIPSAPGNLGTFEGACSTALNVFKIAGNTAIGFALVYRVFLYVPVTTLGFIFLLKEGLSLSLVTSIRDKKLEN
ncbi:lysylphosphatidylglycerol synthase transmembrane domain-containing protein [Pseudobacteroides cellulosolvens]|uniref:Phosphatidylglycerol lysyltransferase n=1 Tax=Pseudobacteroides cellulosolvens ATCC 35603 = DSM 2933 TaxID=398512 RepID=A0A0L6JS80_9FIRM|nr:lysylphosphatidylglycerol synthase transmembrane domain-containing protein [Pseudobacteroides cellulosolvens]KNY28575.1 Lysylphosphatidylglycerol synthetase/glycosyltransferase AglD [Pseudobacteroides cellulosolvens ATCC 35603 = DSM 2933]